MLVKPPLYGLDIAFECREDPGERSRRGDPNGAIVLDPYDSVIVGAGLSTVDGDEFYDGSERRILSILDQRFAVLDPGIIATWNGSILDLPLLRARARALELGLGLRIRPDRRRNLQLVGRSGRAPNRRPAIQVGRTPTGGVRAVSGAWHRQRHLDLRWVYEEDLQAEEPGWQDPCRGAHLARSLAERRWNRAKRHLDRIPPAPPLTSYTWACLDEDGEAGPAVEVPAAAKLRHPSSGAALRR